MRTVETLGTFAEVATMGSPEGGEIAKALRTIILEIMPDVTEVCWNRQKIASYGVGPHKQSEHFCYIGMHPRHVNLGLYYGTELQDPHGMLEGSGKLLRHIKIHSLSDARSPRIRAMIEQAAGHLPRLK